MRRFIQRTDAEINDDLRAIERDGDRRLAEFREWANGKRFRSIRNISARVRIAVAGDMALQRVHDDRW